MRWTAIRRTSHLASHMMNGVIGVNKPEGLTSADVLRRMQHHFKPSELFATSIKEERERLVEAARLSHHGRKVKASKADNVKIGHGGTLDPLATGVLIVGIGAGTKLLQNFLGCSKTYETTVLFGAATDTYDILGKVVAERPTGHVSRHLVEQAIDKLRAQKVQTPPIFSALRYQGKRFYEYAREGKQLPIEIPERPVEIYDAELLEWLEPGTHTHKLSCEHAEPEVRQFAQKEFNPSSDSIKRPGQDGSQSNPQASTLGSHAAVDIDRIVQETSVRHDSGEELVMSGALQSRVSVLDTPLKTSDSLLASAPAAPACRIRLTVSTGFYVRSFAHDLGRAVDSLGLMATLVRSRQEQFELGKNVFEFSELEKGEAVWAPQIQAHLQAWADRQASSPLEKAAPRFESVASDRGPQASSKKRKLAQSHRSRDESHSKRRRNSSSSLDS